MLFSFPPEDSLFGRAVPREIASVRARDTRLRAARRNLRDRFPHADLLRQQDVRVKGVSNEAWFAYRDGRAAASAPSTAWWEERGVARVVANASGRLTHPNAACRALLGIPRSDGQLPMTRDFMPETTCRELADGAEWLAGIHDGTSSTIVRSASNGVIDAEFRVVRDGAGSGRHDLWLRTFADRDADDDRRAISASPIARLSAAHQHLLLSAGTRRRLVAGERLRASVAGEPWAVLVVAGIVRLYVSTEGLEPTFQYGSQGSLLGTHSLGADESLALGFQTVTPSTVIQLDADRVVELAESDLPFARALAFDAQHLLQATLRLYAVRSAANLSQRLAREIMMLADLEPGVPLVSVTAQQLAECVGSIRESVGRTLADFRRRGWVATTYHGVIVLDPGALRALGAVDIA
jgi:CRP/FNR family transcriptional regulator